MSDERRILQQMRAESESPVVSADMIAAGVNAIWDCPTSCPIEKQVELAFLAMLRAA